MVMQADVNAMFKLASAFGPDGIRFALDATEGAVRATVEAAKVQLKKSLTQGKIQSKTTTVSSRVSRSRSGVVGLIRARRPGGFLGPILLGENVPKHTMPARTSAQGPYVMMVGKNKRPKTYAKGPRKGQGPPVFISGKIEHPGYEGRDRMTAIERQGGRVLAQKIGRVALRLAQRLARARR